MKSALKLATASGVAKTKRPSSIRGTKGVMLEIAPKAIHVDPKYQRENNIKRSLRIANNWDWRVFSPISVSERPDGSYYAYDGQHRVVAAQRNEEIETLPCYVVKMADVR